MDIQLIRTYLEIISAGSFNEAAERVHVTQAAVSLRVKRLEEEIGQTLFTRSKKGIELTQAGGQFERFARQLVKVWEEARYQIAVPSGYADLLSIGCQYSLWPKLGGQWLRQLEKLEHDVAFKAEVGMPERLMRMMIQGATDIAIMYTPQVRPGLRVEEIVKEELILVSPDPDYPAALDERYVFMDWGPEFAAAHAIQFASFGMARTNLTIGPLAINFVHDQNRAAYFPTRLVKPSIADGKLHVVAGAPVFPYPAFVVWNTEKNPELMERALAALRKVASVVDNDQVTVLADAEIDLNELEVALQG